MCSEHHTSDLFRFEGLGYDSRHLAALQLYFVAPSNGYCFFRLVSLLFLSIVLSSARCYCYSCCEHSAFFLLGSLPVTQAIMSSASFFAKRNVLNVRPANFFYASSNSTSLWFLFASRSRCVWRVPQQRAKYDRFHVLWI